MPDLLWCMSCQATGTRRICWSHGTVLPRIYVRIQAEIGVRARAFSAPARP